MRNPFKAPYKITSRGKWVTLSGAYREQAGDPLLWKVNESMTQAKKVAISWMKRVTTQMERSVCRLLWPWVKGTSRRSRSSREGEEKEKRVDDLSDNQGLTFVLKLLLER